MQDIFGRIIAVNQQVYLGTGRLWGINSLDISPSFGLQPLNYIGINNKQVNQIVNSEQFIDVTINGNLIDSDQFIQYTGSDCFNIFILQNQGNLDNNYSLISGYLNSYSLKFSVGQPVQTTVGIKFVRDCGKIPTGIMNSNAYNELIQIPTGIYENVERKFHVPSFGSTNLILNEYNNQRITDANIGYKISRTPIYNIGNKSPSKINIIYPIVINCSFTMEINELYSGIELKQISSNIQTQDITFNVFENDNSSNLIASYGFSGMSAINERRGVTVDGNTTITKEFEGYIFN